MFNRKKYMKEYHKKDYPKNKERDLVKHKEWLENNPEYMKKQRENNPERNKEYNRRWNKTEKGKANKQREHVTQRVNGKDILNTLTAEEWLDILKQHNYKCAYCGKDLFTLFTRPERDHIIPISKGGNNIKDNIAPACHSCNSKKHNKILREEIMKN